METLSALLAVWEGNPSVNVYFPHKAELWCFLCSNPEQVVEQTVNSRVASGDTRVHSNEYDSTHELNWIRHIWIELHILFSILPTGCYVLTRMGFMKEQ